MLNALASSSRLLAPTRSRYLPLARLAPLASNLVIPAVSLPLSARSLHSTHHANQPPSHRPVSLSRLAKDLEAYLLGSPSGYIMKRAFITALPTRSPSTPTTQQKPRAEPEESFEDESEPDPNLSAYARLKLLFKRYGWYALGMYTVLSALDFSLCFVLIHLAGAERIEPLLTVVGGWYRRTRYGDEAAAEMARESAIEAEVERKKIQAEEREGRAQKKKSGWFSRTVLAELALAYPIHKVALLPVRAGLTVAWTPKFVGWLTRRGWVGKGGYTRAASHAQDKIRTAKDRVKERVQDMKP